MRYIVHGDSDNRAPMIKIENTKERKSFIRLSIWCVAVQGILYQGRNGNRRHISHDKQFQISRAPFVTIIRFITGGIRGREKEEGEKKKRESRGRQLAKTDFIHSRYELLANIQIESVQNALAWKGGRPFRCNSSIRSGGVFKDNLDLLSRRYFQPNPRTVKFVDRRKRDYSIPIFWFESKNNFSSNDLELIRIVIKITNVDLSFHCFDQR